MGYPGFWNPLLPSHDPHLGGLLAAPPSSFDICGFQRSISSTCFVFLVPRADSMEEGVEEEPWVPRFMVAVLYQDPPAVLTCRMAAALSFPCPGGAGGGA